MNILNFLTFILNLPAFFWNKLTYVKSSLEDPSPFLERTKSTSDFVDKTLLIKTIIETDVPRLITAPRGFGKTFNMKMLQAFLEMKVDRQGKQLQCGANVRSAFKKLKIYKNDRKFFDRNFCQHPVISVKFNNIGVLRIELIVDIIKREIHKVFRLYRYLCTSDKLNEENKYLCSLWCHKINYKKLSLDDVRMGLLTLAEYFYKHHGKKSIVLIDDFDVPIMWAMFNEDDNRANAIPFVLNMYSQVVRRNPYVKNTIITGISYLAGSGLIGVNNLQEHRFLEDNSLIDFYGFTDTEFNDILKRQPKKISEEIVRFTHIWYGGYTSKMGKQIYCPYTIERFLHSREIMRYWSGRGSEHPLRNALNFDYIKYKLLKLFKNESISVKFLDDMSMEHILKVRLLNDTEGYTSDDLTNIFFTFIFEQGYLSFCKFNRSLVSLPNLEVKAVIGTELQNFIHKVFKLDSDFLLNCTCFFDGAAFMVRTRIADPNFENIVYYYQNMLERTLKSLKHNKLAAPYKTPTFKDARIFNHKVFVSILFSNNFLTTDTQLYSRFIRRTKEDGKTCLSYYMIDIDFAIILQLHHSGTMQPNSTIPLSQILEGKYYNAFDDEQITPQHINYYLLFALSVNSEAKVSVSYLLNSKDISNAVHFPRVNHTQLKM